MKLKNILQKISKNDCLDVLISEYYDDEMNISNKLEFEVKIALSEVLRDYYYEDIYENFQISNSIKLTKNRTKSYSNAIIERIYKGKKFKKCLILFYFNTILFKYINKVLRR